MPQLLHLQYGNKNTSYSFNKYLLSMFYMPNTVLGMGDTAMNKTDRDPWLHGVYILAGVRNNKRTGK